VRGKVGGFTLIWITLLILSRKWLKVDFKTARKVAQLS
jgi:hypothetical protein